MLEKLIKARAKTVPIPDTDYILTTGGRGGEGFDA